MKSILSVAAATICLFASSAVAKGSDAVRAKVMDDCNHIRYLADNLTMSIKAWNGEASPTTALTTALSNIHEPANGTVQYLIDATAELKKTPTTFTIDQAFRVAGTVQDLAYSVNASVAALNGKAKALSKYSANAIVTIDLGNLLNATQAFSNQLISYVQPKLQPIAFALRDQAIDSLQQGLDCFKNVNNTVACSTVVIDSQRSHQDALRWGAIHRDGTPIA